MIVIRGPNKSEQTNADMQKENTKIKNFKDLSICPQLSRAIKKMGFQEMTPVQEKTFQPIMDKGDVLALAPTGTGKTCGFGVPIIEATDPKIKKVQSVILCPTRELARQTVEVLHQLTAFTHGVKVVAIYGGENINRQIQRLKGRPQIIVATPGRMMDHINRRTIRLQDVKTVVLDEGDTMLDMGFRKDIDKIMESIPETRQMVLFSATMSDEIRQISNRYLKNEHIVKINGESRAVDTVKQYSSEVRKQKKTSALVKLLTEKKFVNSLIFVRTKSKARQLSKILSQQGFDAMALHGDLTQRQRDVVMNKYKKRQVQILVATDIASRGIDVDHIEAVINYDIPEDSDSYVHRIGRTGRANQKGSAYTLIDPSERKKLHYITRTTNSHIEKLVLHDLKDITPQPQPSPRKERPAGYNHSGKNNHRRRKNNNRNRNQKRAPLAAGV